MKLLLLTLIISVTGCKSVSDGFTGSLQELGKDNATIIIVSPQFGRAIRTNPRSDQTVEIDTDGRVKITGHGATNILGQ